MVSMGNLAINQLLLLPRIELTVLGYSFHRLLILFEISLHCKRKLSCRKVRYVPRVVETPAYISLLRNEISFPS